MPRVAIAGGPRTGKTTYGSLLASRLGHELISTDDYMSAAWEDVPGLVIARLRGLEGFVLEGVQAGRVLRRWYAEDPSGPRLDGLLVLSRPHVALTAKQAAMARGCDTVLRDVVPLCRRLGVDVRLGLPEALP